MIIIAHNYAQVLEVCDRVNLLQHGRITFDRPAARDVGAASSPTSWWPSTARRGG